MDGVQSPTNMNVHLRLQVNQSKWKNGRIKGCNLPHSKQSIRSDASIDDSKSICAAWRIAEVVIQERGTNTFLRTTKFHTAIRRDFDETSTGVAPRA